MVIVGNCRLLIIPSGIIYFRLIASLTEKSPKDPFIDHETIHSTRGSIMKG